MLSFRLKQVAKMGAQHIVLPVFYRIFCLQKVKKDRVVFADAHHDRRPESMDTLCYTLKKSGRCKVIELYADYQKISFGKLMKVMIRFMYLYAGAGTVVICDNFLPAASCKKRKGTTVIQLWHACGSLKKFGYDAPDDIPPSFKGHVFKNTDIVTVSSPECVRPFAGAMKLPEENILPIGVPRTDLYYSDNWNRRKREALFELYPEAEGKKIALWAPTFRGNAAEGRSISLDLEKLREMLGREWLVITCLHPHMRGQYEDDPYLCPLSSAELFPAVDVLIADYSSLIFEYMLFQKGLVLYAPDLETYRSERGFYLDYDQIPAVHVSRFEDLADAVRLAGVGPDAAMREETDRFLDTYMSACDGKATRRVRALIEEGLTGQ